jgi:hypothetical protein
MSERTGGTTGKAAYWSTRVPSDREEAGSFIFVKARTTALGVFV